MCTYIVVTDGAYGISFSIVRSDSKESALSMVCGDDAWVRGISHVIDVDNLIESSNPDYGIIYEQEPSSG